MINIIVKQTNNDLQVSVKDSGIGIRDSDKGNLMNAFGKSDSDESKTLNRQGVGLGLLISNMIAKSLNLGNEGLQFRSSYGEGFVNFYL